MKRAELKQILKDVYKTDSIKSIMCGRSKPSYTKMLEFSKKGIPFEAWLDIKSFITNDNKSENCGQELQDVNECDGGNNNEL
jgi:hypothetical protein